MIKKILMIMIMCCCAPLVHAEDLPSDEQKNEAKEKAIQQEFEGFNLNGYTDGGAKAWEINGDKANISDEKVKITNVNANSYGEQNVNLKSKKGSIDKASGNVHLEKDVVITSDQGAQMTTDTLDWKRTENIVSTQDSVEIKDDTMKITGKGMVAQPNMKTASIHENVKADVTGAPNSGGVSQNISITSDGPMEMDQLKQVVVFNENVVATEATTGRQLKADKMEVYFDQQSKSIKKLVCIGNVSVHQGENISYSDQLVYDAATQKMTLSGKPKLVFDLNSQSGAGKNIFKGLGE
jgi:LPS export ABC transporter protein LptC/lipopolysaccharide transport protein LptA